MKMRRSLWRKLLVLAFAILTAVSTFLTVTQYNANHEKVANGIELNGVPTATVVPNPDDGELPYLCTVCIPLINTTSIAKKPISVVATISGGTLEIPFPLSSLGAGKSCEVTTTFSTSRESIKITAVSLTFSGKADEVLLGNSSTKSIPNYLKAMIAISIILFCVFIYTCVALYKSPKKRVHSRHRHHHHHHSSETEHSGDSKSR